MGKKRTRRRNKGKSKTIKKREPKLLGVGKDGCIMDSISCGRFSKESGYVSKFLFNNKKINIELNNKLEELDPTNERFNRYYLPDIETCIETDSYKADYNKCSESGEISSNNMVFQKRLEPLNGMTKKQYRYLRDSLQILHKNGISHGDLPNNVMLDSLTENPVIIDWEEAKINADDLDKQIDMTAFLTHFKVTVK